MSKQEKEEKRNKKALFAFIALFASAAIIIGAAFAFFSDIITGSGSVTAGTLDISGSFVMKHYNAAGVEVSDTGETNTLIPNLNPGDLVHISAAGVTNVGNKSAHIRGLYTLSGALFTNAAPNGVKVVDGATTKTAAACAAATALTNTGTVGEYATAPAIINGTGANAEVEAGGVSTYNSGILVCLPTAADNSAQGNQLSVGAKIQAIQYRNNTTNPDWTTVVSTSFGS